MNELVVNEYRCPQNHQCPAVTVCPVGALEQDGFDAPAVDNDKCIKCGKCVNFCPMRALQLQ
jgi:ferredoxin